MFSRHQLRTTLLFGLSDILLTTAAFEAAYYSRLWLRLERNFYLALHDHILLLGFCVLAWFYAGRWIKIAERLEGGRPLVIARDAGRQCLMGVAGLVLFEYLLRLDLSRPFVLLFVGYAWVLLFLFRVIAVGARRQRQGEPHFVLVAGTGESALRLGRALEAAAPYGVRLMGFLSYGNGPAVIGLKDDYPVHSISKLPALLRGQVIDEILFTLENRNLADFDDVLLLCDEQGVRTRVLVDFFPHVNSEIYLEQLGRMPLLTFSAVPHDEVRLLLKRSIDIAVAGAALALLSPLLLLVAALVRLTSPGPAIFRQVRCGLNGRRFILYKFRSMCENAEELKPQLAHLNRKSTVFKIPDDPRLTQLGRYLRKFSVDEWPQLWNVLKGDMSLVGPRPAVPDEVDEYKGWQRRRLRMRPGLTCLWALEGRDALDFDTWMKKDMQYIDNWSLALDWKILFLTIPQVLTGKGAH